MKAISKWFKQLLCPHTIRSWKTEPVTESMTHTTGGCVRCGKWISPWCKECGR